jgi:glycosyltransferase involved in cell wall biosynthesis
VLAGASISCIVPVFNGERFLAETLDSILKQTCAPFEILVVDDGSTDGTPGLIRRYGSRVRYLWQANAGPASARNTGIAAATGEFVSFLDADDVWHPEKLARQMQRFEVRSDLGICLSHIQNFYMPEVSAEEQLRKDDPRARPIAGYSSVTLLARRALFEAIGGFDTTLQHGDDTDWFIRAERHGALLEVLPEVLVFRRLHADNRSRKWAARSREEYLRLMKQFVDARRAQPPK